MPTENRQTANNGATPPGFEEAANLRQQARAAGMDPDYWYAVEEVRNIKPGTVVEVVFWKRSIALFRSAEGLFHALENRCIHRQLKLSLGNVQGCRLVCAYHGWQYDENGCCVETTHNRFGQTLPNLALRTYPVQVRYGLVWLFPGDPAQAQTRQIRTSPSSKAPNAGPVNRWALPVRPTTPW